MNAKNICLKSIHVSGIWCHAHMIKATEANPEARNLNIVLRGLSGWFLFPCWSSSENKFTKSHQLDTPKLDVGQEAAAPLRSGQRGGRGDQGTSRVKTCGHCWAAAGEVWPRQPGNSHEWLTSESQPPSSGNSACRSVPPQLMPFLHPKYHLLALKPASPILIRKTWSGNVLHYRCDKNIWIHWLDLV